MKGSTRTHLGPHFSEGCRLAWVQIQRQQVDRAALRKRLKGRRGATLATGVLDRVLYGDQGISLSLAVQLRKVLGVRRLEAWLEEPRAAFDPPSALRDVATLTPRAASRKRVARSGRDRVARA